MTDDVEPGRGGDAGGRRARQQGIDDRHGRPHEAVRDPAFCLLVRDVEDGDRGRLRARSRGGRDGDQREERRGRLPAAADRRVDVVHDLTAMALDEVRDLGRVDGRSAAERHEAVDIGPGRDSGGACQRPGGRLDADVLEERDLDAAFLDEPDHPLGDAEAAERRIGDEKDAPGPEPAQLVGDVVDGARPVAQLGRFQGDDGLVLHGRRRHPDCFSLPLGRMRPPDRHSPRPGA